MLALEGLYGVWVVNYSDIFLTVLVCLQCIQEVRLQGPSLYYVFSSNDKFSISSRVFIYLKKKKQKNFSAHKKKRGKLFDKGNGDLHRFCEILFVFLFFCNVRGTFNFFF